MAEVAKTHGALPCYFRIVVIKKSGKDGPCFDIVGNECIFGR